MLMKTVANLVKNLVLSKLFQEKVHFFSEKS